MRALCFGAPDKALLAQLSADDWKKALGFSDRAGLTLPLALTCRDGMPDWVEHRLDRNLSNNAERWCRTKITYREAASAFEAGGLEFAVLKGFSHYPYFVTDPRNRTQGDLDLLFHGDQVTQAYEVALDLGYEPIRPDDPHPLNHLPTLIRKTGWEWKGDFFDPEMPISLELHFQLWQTETERFAATGVEAFWERREAREVDGVCFTSLHPADEVAHAALHLLRHLLQGSLRPCHVYELGWMLHHSADESSFWNAWRELHDASLRRLEAICFALAQHWFDCRMPEVVCQEIEDLPPQVTRWLAEYGWSPLASRFHPNKDELWLHWSLLDTASARASVLRRRLLPEHLPGFVDGVHIPNEKRTWRIRVRSHWRSVRYTTSRLLHHTRALRPTALSAIRWFGAGLELGADYWRLLLSEGFFDFGMFVFFFLYNLYLLKLGFREDFLGLMSSVMTAGNIVGSILAVFAIQRFGLRKTLMASFALTAGVSAFRAVVLSAPPLLALAAVAGLISSVWPVALAPAVASVTTEKSRPRGFSFVCSSGIAIGIFGSLAAGRLPGWVSRLHLASSSIGSYRVALLAGCSIVLLSLWPLSRAKMGTVPPLTQRKFRRPSPLLARFLFAMLIWNLGTGLFNPFRSVFFARQIHMALQQIGYVFSWSQVLQVGAILVAPRIFRRFGLMRSISGMELATAVTLVGLAAVTGPLGAAVAYCAFMAAQYMSEPGMFTFLMDSVAIGERNSASALNFLVSFAGQGIAAASAGALLARFGYPPLLTGAAVLCAIAAICFRVLLSTRQPDSPTPP